MMMPDPSHAANFDVITFGDLCVDLIVSGKDVVPQFGQVEKLMVFCQKLARTVEMMRLAIAITAPVRRLEMGHRQSLHHIGGIGVLLEHGFQQSGSRPTALRGQRLGQFSIVMREAIAPSHGSRELSLRPTKIASVVGDNAACKIYVHRVRL